MGFPALLVKTGVDIVLGAVGTILALEK